MVERIESDPILSVELAAAGSQIRAHALLSSAFEARPDLTQKDIADRLRVSEGRVSQILRGDDDLRVTTLGRYLRALGYEWDAGLVSKEQTAPELSRQKPERQRGARSDLYIGVAMRGSERAPSFTFVPEGFALDTSEEHVHFATIETDSRPIQVIEWTHLAAEDLKTIDE